MIKISKNKKILSFLTFLLISFFPLAFLSIAAETPDAGGTTGQFDTIDSVRNPLNSGSTGAGGTFGTGKTSGSGGGSQSIKIPNPLGNVKTFGELINRLVNWLLIIGAPILTLMIIVGAFQIMTGAGEPEKITKGRHTITYAIIGYALLLISTGITTIIANVLSNR